MRRPAPTVSAVRVFPAVLLLFAAACADAPTETALLDPDAPAFAATARGACVAPATYVVSDEPGLQAALSAAVAGDVVAVDGTVDLYGGAVRIPAGVTLTCATPGSGLVRRDGHFAVVMTTQSDVTVAGLVLDGAATSWAVYAVDVTGDVRGFTLRSNEVVCGWAGCVFVVGVPGSVLSGNRVEATHWTSSGLHLQGGVDGTILENNVVTAHVAAGAPLFGALRPRDGSDVVVRGNTVRGPWSNGLAMAELRQSTFEGNEIEGARQFGLFLGANAFTATSVEGSLFRTNVLVSTGGPAVYAQFACGNVLTGNRLSAPASEPTVAFSDVTGANAVLGRVASAEDNGAFDCDGDGANDPNMIAGATRGGAYVGEIVAPVMQPTAGLELR